MPLPGEHDRPPVPPMKYRLSIGEVAPTSSGKTAPRKMDYFQIRRLTRQGDKPTYMVDQALQKAMCAASGVTEKPTAVPVTLVGNIEMVDGKPVIPESILFAEMARYWGGRRECCCKQWDEETGVGTAKKRNYAKETRNGREVTVFTGEEEIACDPATCPFATGRHNIGKYAGVALCKPHVIASVCLPFAPSVGSAAKVKTTGWASYFGMRDSLLTIGLQTGGWLHDIPLLLVLDWGRSADGQAIPILRFEYEGNVDALRDTMIPLLGRWKGQDNTIKQLQAGQVASTVDLVEDQDDQRATNAEFYPETAFERVEVRLERDPEPEVEAAPAIFTEDNAIDGEFEPVETPDEQAIPGATEPLQATKGDEGTITPSVNAARVIAKQKALLEKGFAAETIKAATAKFREDIAPESKSINDLGEDETQVLIDTLEMWSSGQSEEL
jgi:hypothetical protein